MIRFIDLLSILGVAVVLLLPKASIEARPALDGEAIELDRIARLQNDVFREPEDADALLQLADGFLSFGRADWAIVALSRFTSAEAAGEKWAADPVARASVHLLRAAARAERLEAAETVEEASLIEQACQGGPPACAPLQTRADLIRGAMKSLVDEKIDPARDPQRAKDAVYRALHPLRSNFRR